MNIPEKYKKVRDISITPEDLITFETKVKDAYESGQVKGPIHLAKNNETQLIEVFQYIDKDDWVFVPWRNHYQALLHGVDEDKLFENICNGNSMHTNNVDPNFYSSSIVGGIIPLALGAALALKRKEPEERAYMLPDRQVWCFVGDMTMETGIFHEAYKYAKNFDLPLNWVIEDNNLSVHTPTDMAWKDKQNVPDDVIYFKYEMGYPHHGTGKWVNF